jgi:uncharacterized protein (TIGR02145 family)
MKNFSTKTNLILILLFSILLESCKKDKPSIPILNTKNVTEISNTTAISGGNVTNDGGAPILSKGVCFSSSSNPTTIDLKTNEGPGTGSFSSSITALTPNTIYYVRAYAVNAVGSGYGDEISFTTSPILVPTLTTTEISSTTQTSAISGGNVISDNGGPVNVRGVCWSINPNPTITDSKTSDGEGLGTFISKINGLSANTIYYLRAYATNIVGTQYGNEINFTTNPLPTISTKSISSISTSGCTTGGDISSDGGVTIINRGVCWSKNPNPTLNDFYTSDGVGTGSFSSVITGLEPNTLYYIRSYVENISCTTYGNEMVLKTYLETLSDYAGNVYNTVKIGTQIWMAENLKTIYYNDGTLIPQIPPSTSSWETPGYCWYKNDETTYKSDYGGLYNWYSVQTNKLCPTGWHVPTDNEFETLKTYLGGANYCAGKLKESGLNHWLAPNQGATNESGFTALPGGKVFATSSFNFLGTRGSWWSSTEYDVDPAWADAFSIVYDKISSIETIGVKAYCYSIRCIKD